MMKLLIHSETSMVLWLKFWNGKVLSYKAYLAYDYLSLKGLKLIYFDKSDPRKKMEPGGRLNKKDGLTRYGDSHVKDKTS